MTNNNNGKNHDEFRGHYSHLDQSDRLKAGLPLTFEGEIMIEPRRRHKHISEHIPQGAARMRRRYNGEERPVATPWASVNRQLRGGFWPGLHTLTAPPAKGKTTFAVTVAKYAAANGVPVLYLGLELDDCQAVSRFHCESNWSDVCLGFSEFDEAGAEKELGSLPIYLDLETGWRTSYLLPAIEDIKANHNASTVFCIVDYLQIVGAEPGARSELREIMKKAAYDMRHVARTTNTVILAVSSTARDNYTKGEFDALMGPNGSLPKPDKLIGAAKESGDIEYAGDSASLLIPLPKASPGTTAFATAKNRYYTPAWCALHFDGTSFDELNTAAVWEDIHNKNTGAEANGQGEASALLQEIRDAARE